MINDSVTIIKIPNVISMNSIEKLLTQFEFIFISDVKNRSNVFLDMSKLRKTSLLGTLIIYKFMSYAVTHNCFNNPQLVWEQEQRDIFDQYGFAELLKRCLEKKSRSVLASVSKMNSVVTEELIIAPQVLIRDSRLSKSKKQDMFISHLSNHYEDVAIKSCISTGVGELIMNFWEHATEDSETIVLGRGTKDYFELILADSGEGIISTIKPLFPDISNQKVLEKSIERGITSKKNTFHMGSGLWFVSELTRRNNGILDIYSEGHLLQVTPTSTRCRKTAYWKGTITYWKINTENVQTVSSFLPKKSNKGIQLNLIEGDF